MSDSLPFEADNICHIELQLCLSKALVLYIVYRSQPSSENDTGVLFSILLVKDSVTLLFNICMNRFTRCQVP